jgi:hypothetical protein
MALREAGERQPDNAGGSRKLSAVASVHSIVLNIFVLFRFRFYRHRLRFRSRFRFRRRIRYRDRLRFRNRFGGRFRGRWLLILVRFNTFFVAEVSHIVTLHILLYNSIEIKCK